MKSSMTALLVAMFTLGTAGAFAQEPGGFGQEPQEPTQSSPGMDIQDRDFSELDLDGDGVLTRTEAEQAGIESVTFDSMDQDGDGEVSEEDFQRAQEEGGVR